MKAAPDRRVEAHVSEKRECSARREGFVVAVVTIAATFGVCRIPPLRLFALLRSSTARQTRDT
jgi:hypothetical protein